MGKMEMTMRALIREREGNKYRRTKEGKVTVRMSEKVIRNHIINHLFKIPFLLKVDI